MNGYKLIEKTDGDGNLIEVWEKIEFNDDGYPIKIKRKPTNIIPKKKKRKKTS